MGLGGIGGGGAAADKLIKAGDLAGFSISKDGVMFLIEGGREMGGRTIGPGCCVSTSIRDEVSLLAVGNLETGREGGIGIAAIAASEGVLGSSSGGGPLFEGERDGGRGRGGGGGAFLLAIAGSRVELRV